MAFSYPSYCKRRGSAWKNTISFIIREWYLTLVVNHDLCTSRMTEFRNVLRLLYEKVKFETCNK